MTMKIISRSKMTVMLIFIVFYPQKFLAAQGERTMTTPHKACA